MGEVRSFLKAADQYFFGWGSATTLGVFRIFVGTLAFLNLLMISIDWDAWFSERGFVPDWVGNRAAGGGLIPVWSLDFKVLGHAVAVPQINVLNGITDPRITIPIYWITAL